MSEEKTLYLVDGTYLLFRAYHSLPATMAVLGETFRRNRDELAALVRAGAGTPTDSGAIADVALHWLGDSTKDRLPTNAVRGLTSVLVKLVREARPGYIGVAFDIPGRVHRDDHYDHFVAQHPDYAPKLGGYKATRPETPRELAAQFPLARIVCRHGLGIPVLEAENFEADDLIGTLARRARGKGFRVWLVTADKDLFQLVDDGISILNPHKPDPKGPSGYLLMDAKVVEREFGVPPEKVVDVLALMGDTSDNIPGVPGIGEKGARELITRFGSVERCLEAAKEEGTITRKAYRTGLLEHGRLALLSKELATIHEDAPIALDVDDLRACRPDLEAATRVFTLLAFEGFLRDVQASAERTAVAAEPAASPGAAAAARAPEATREARGGTGAAGTGAAGGARASGTSSELVPGAPQGKPSGADRRPGGRGSSEPALAGTLAARGVTGARERSSQGVLGFDDSPAQEAQDSAVSDAREEGTAVPAEELAPSAGEIAAEPTIAPVDPSEAERYRVVTDLGELAALLPSILAAPRVAIDAEATTEGPLRAELVGIAIAWEPGRAIYVPIAHRYLGAPPQPSNEDVLRTLAPLLEDAGRPKTAQNVKYDIEVLRRAGSKAAGFDFDTMIAAFLLQADRPNYSLSSIAKEYLGEYRTGFSEAAGRGAKQVSFDQVEVVRAAAYSGRDADVTLRLADFLAKQLESEKLDHVLTTIDMPLVEVLVAMETAGVRIDVPLLQRYSREMSEQIAAIRADIYRLAGHEFNVDSPQQLARVLFEEAGLKPVSRTTKSGAASTRDDDLEALAELHPLPQRVREYRTLAKLRSTYVDALPQMVNPETGRVHTSFNPAGAATGRLSSSDPNLQNIPVRSMEGRKIRAAFVTDPGWSLVSADYSQVELRVLAHLTGDPDLISAFSRGEDIHRTTAARMFGLGYEAVSSDQRRAAKTINFGILYGMGPQRLARELSIPQSDAKAMIAAYFGRFPSIRAWIDGTIEQAGKDGYVRTLFGRIRRFPELASTSRGSRQMAVRAAVNSGIQGTAADLMKLAMIRLHRALAAVGLRTRILIQVHDELVLEAPLDELAQAKEIIRESMEQVHPLETPLLVEISSGPNWLEAKP